MAAGWATLVEAGPGIPCADGGTEDNPVSPGCELGVDGDGGLGGLKMGVVGLEWEPRVLADSKGCEGRTSAVPEVAGGSRSRELELGDTVGTLGGDFLLDCIGKYDLRKPV